MKVGILGAGAWGTTLSILLRRKYPNEDIVVWTRNKRLILDVKKYNENKRYLKGVFIPDSIKFTNSIEYTVKDADFIIFAVSSDGIVTTAQSVLPHIQPHTLVISASKGLILGESTTLPKRLSTILKENLNIEEERIGVISGPSFAQEVVKEIPTALVASSYSYSTAQRIQELFFSVCFRVYTNCDIIGVELGGALKNIIAIAAGIVDGLKLGESSKAALLTRGLAEMIRLSVALGAQEATLSGLSGVGDLIATSYSKYSRNRKFGFLLAKGLSVSSAKLKINHVIEGIATSLAAIQLKNNYNIEMPITQEVYSIIFESKDISAAMNSLLARKHREEIKKEVSKGE